jgi:hypothetical protein
VADLAGRVPPTPIAAKIRAPAEEVPAVQAQQRPAAVRIEDLAAPTFPPEMAELRRAVAALAGDLRLERDALVADARRQTGLSDLGDPGFAERLDVLLRALREEAGLSSFGMVSNYMLLKQLLCSRLLLEDLLRRHPEIDDVPIERPIVIAGLPRTGTTHLHNLLSADPALRALPYWESLEPLLAPGETDDGGAPDPRIARTEMALGMVNGAMPYFVRMHEMTADHVHEEIQLLAIDFSSMLFETIALMPSWRDYYRAHDQTPHYAYLKRILQALTWLRGGRRWVLKSPQHLEQLGPLVRVFPDATFVVTHRDPVSITASMATMIAYTARMNVDRPDPVACGRYWSARVEDLLRGCVRDRELLPAARSIDVRFQDLTADDFAMVERICALAGHPLTPTARAAMDAFLAAHPRGRHGTVVYDMAALGLDRAERRKALRFYSERFALEDES